MLRLVVYIFITSACFNHVYSQYEVPEIKLEAFTPKGFRAYIPNAPGLQLFGFHGKVNDQISPAEPGEIGGDVKNSNGSYWMFFDPNVELHVGDKINYWVFIQYNRLGYRKDNLSWNVKELIKESSLPLCDMSSTVIGSQEKLCKGITIFEDNFKGLNTNKWRIEKYIPFNRPNFEFNYYDPNAVKVVDSKLIIKPIVVRKEGENKRKLDLTESCTGVGIDECTMIYPSPKLLPPVMSGMLTSNFKFKYGQVEIKARLPSGDWIFPEISLVPVDNNYENSNESRLWIAYARGNENFEGNDGINTGGSLLFGGLVKKYTEPDRSSELRTLRNVEPYSKQMHTFTLIWLPDQIRLLVDNIEYGKMALDDDPFDKECQLVIGVCVGGTNDFPDDYRSGNVKKPWTNKQKLQVKQFMDGQNVWKETWNNYESLEVDYVRISAV